MTSQEFVWARSDDPRCAEWESSGYVLVGQSWGAHLHIGEQMDLAKYRSMVEHVEIAETKLRILDISEIDRIIDLERKNLNDYPFTPATIQHLPTAEYLRALILSEGAIFGAIHGNKLVGVLATKKDLGKIEFEFASIDPQFRGKRIATALGAFAILKYLSEGSKSFATGGAAVNAASKGTVESLGFTIDEFWRSYKVQ